MICLDYMQIKQLCRIPEVADSVSAFTKYSSALLDSYASDTYCISYVDEQGNFTHAHFMRLPMYMLEQENFEIAERYMYSVRADAQHSCSKICANEESFGAIQELIPIQEKLHNQIEFLHNNSDSIESDECKKILEELASQAILWGTL